MIKNLITLLFLSFLSFSVQKRLLEKRSLGDNIPDPIQSPTKPVQGPITTQNPTTQGPLVNKKQIQKPVQGGSNVTCSSLRSEWEHLLIDILNYQSDKTILVQKQNLNVEYQALLLGGNVTDCNGVQLLINQVNGDILSTQASINSTQNSIASQLTAYAGLISQESSLIAQIYQLEINIASTQDNLDLLNAQLSNCNSLDSQYTNVQSQIASLTASIQLQQSICTNLSVYLSSLQVVKNATIPVIISKPKQIQTQGTVQTQTSTQQSVSAAVTISQLSIQLSSCNDTLAEMQANLAILVATQNSLLESLNLQCNNYNISSIIDEITQVQSQLAILVASKATAEASLAANLQQIVVTIAQIDSLNQQLDNLLFELALLKSKLVKANCKLDECENQLAVKALIVSLEAEIATLQIKISNELAAIKLEKSTIISQGQGLNCSCFWSSIQI